MTTWRTAALLAATMLTATAGAADAQSMYYARERLAGVASSKTSETTPAPTGGSWTSTTWSAWSSTCSTTATRTRTVTCTNGSGVVADSACTGAKPDASETANVSTGCPQWTPGAWSQWSSTCSSNATRTRTVTCQDPTSQAIVPDARCAAAKPATSDGPTEILDGCQYTWQPIALSNTVTRSYCTGSTITVSQSYACYRNGDYVDGHQAAASNCSSLRLPAAVVTDVSCVNNGVTFPGTESANGAGNAYRVKYFAGVMNAAQAKAAGTAMCTEEAAAFGSTYNAQPFCIIEFYKTNATLGQTAVQAGFTVKGDAMPAGAGWSSLNTIGKETIGYRTYTIGTGALTMPSGATCSGTSSSPYWRRICE